MSILIQTKYLGPTNTRGSRVKAQLSGDGVSVTVPYPPELNGVFCHEVAVHALCDKYNIKDRVWTYHYFPGGYIFIGENKPVV